MKVLVVDDSVVMRRIMINALSQASIDDVEQAADGAEGVNKVGDGAYDLVLMDWNMPNLLGIDAVKKIRENGHTVPIIMVTTEAEKSRVVEALKAGANNYIIKPFQPKVLISKIQDVMKKVGKAA
ncbi:MAG: response regulator [Candidatus Zixiibacteriota bacterium]